MIPLYARPPVSKAPSTGMEVERCSTNRPGGSTGAAPHAAA
jgi:hypothetical protein